MRSNTELLLPVGNLEMCLAAIHNGADAIYMGVSGFNARGRSQDIPPSEAKEIIDLCHLYGVRVNLAFNIVIFENELSSALDTLLEYLPLGPDAFIVQDLGLARLIRALAPEQAVHGSTQMTMTSFEGIRLLDDLGIKRFVLGRENTIEEIKLIRKNTDKELEVFVHGALCVAYSGQCFTSESIGGRSANRGQCAQSCRLSYEMYVDGKKRNLGAKRYLVSPQDLCGIEDAPELARIGVDSLKIEGRLKAPEYVAAAAKSYSLKLQGLPYDASELALTYSRGFFTGWLHGVDHQKLVPADHSSHKGVFAGIVEGVNENRATIKTDRTLAPGQGMLFIGENETCGAKIFQVLSQKNGLAEIALRKGEGNNKVTKGMEAYLNSDPSVQAQLARSFKDYEKMKRVPIDIEAFIAGNRLVIKARDEKQEIKVTSQEAVEEPQKRATTAEDIEKELGKLGRSPFVLSSFKFYAERLFYFSQRELKSLRRQMVEALIATRTSVKLGPIHKDLASSLIANSSEQSSKEGPRKLHLLIREKEQLAALYDIDLSQIDSVTLDYEFGKDYKESLQTLKNKGIKAGLATTRVHKPKEYYNLNMLIRLRPDYILVRNLGRLPTFRTKGQSLRRTSL